VVRAARLFPAVYLVTVAGPGVAGILLSGLAGGWARLRDLRSRLLRSALITLILAGALMLIAHLPHLVLLFWLL